MKIYDNTREELETKVTTCWRCGLSMDEKDFRGKTLPEVKCPRCGFIVETTTQKNRLINAIFAVGLLAGLLGLMLGSLL